MRILFVATALDRPETYMLRGLIDRGLEIRLLIREKSAALSASFPDDTILGKVPLRSRMDFRSMVAIRSAIRSFKPDLIHSLSARAVSSSLFASIGASVKHVAYRGTMGNLNYWDPSSLISFLHPKMNKIICVSDAVLNDLKRIGVAPEKLVRIYKGHDPEWYQDIESVSRESFGARDDEFVITCVANSRPVKGVDVLLRAFLKIPASERVRLVLVGEVRDGELREIAASDARVQLLGFRKDAPAIVRASNLFCMPSRRREGFPKALIEAMIQGVPAVVTTVGGMPEMVIDGHSGLVVPPDDEDRLAAALQQFIRNPSMALQYGARAREHVLEKFRIQGTIAETEAVYRELLEA